jgi:hypothetical protein
LLWAAFAYGAGIVAGARAWKPALWWVIAALTFVGAGTYLSWLRVWLGFGLALGLLFFVGALEIQLRTSAPLAGREFLHFADGRETIIPAHVTHEGEIRAGSYGGSRQSIDVETEQVCDGDAGSTIHAACGWAFIRRKAIRSTKKAVPLCPGASFDTANACVSR